MGQARAGLPAQAVPRPLLPQQPGDRRPGRAARFLVGILSPSQPGQAYIHFAGVAPIARHRGFARLLCEEFFALARADGRTTVSAVTSPGNDGSVWFHRALGFTVTGPVAGYNGPGRDRIVFERALQER